MFETFPGCIRILKPSGMYTDPYRHMSLSELFRDSTVKTDWNFDACLFFSFESICTFDGPIHISTFDGPTYGVVSWGVVSDPLHNQGP